jgi:perosamine synthetase
LASSQSSSEVYQKSVRETFRFLKETETLDRLLIASLPLKNSGGYLAPACTLHVSDPSITTILADWRKANASAFPTQFPVTLEGTSNWLRSKILDVPGRILFFVLDQHGHPLGHLGFANCLNEAREMEIDNVVRGVFGRCPGIMSEALQVLLDWAEEMFAPGRISLRVFDDNHHAIAFYTRAGFEPSSVIALRRNIDGDLISYQPVGEGSTEPPDKYFSVMEYRPVPQISNSLILTAGPSISARESWYTLDAVRNGWNEHCNQHVESFETAFASHVGVRFAIATSSCTGALHLALAALGIGSGDEVIVPEITWVATANAVAYTAASPVFCDVEPDTWCMAPDSFEAKITPRTRAVIPVHLYGHPARMNRIVAIARKYNLRIVEDAAPAVGAEFQGKRVGTFGDFAAFSFQGAKLLVTGEGGMLVTDNPELYAKARSFADQGRRPGTFWIERRGWKYKMSSLQAALGLAQLERVEEFIEAKRRIFSWYASGLADVPGIRLNREAPWARSIYWMTSILLEECAPVSPDHLRLRLKQRNIDTRPVFPAISQYPIWPTPREPQPVALTISHRGINLPSGVRLRRSSVEYICATIRELIREAG